MMLMLIPMVSNVIVILVVGVRIMVMTGDKSVSGACRVLGCEACFMFGPMFTEGQHGDCLEHEALSLSPAPLKVSESRIIEGLSPPPTSPFAVVVSVWDFFFRMEKKLP